jgi:hypothetical protein
VGTLFTSHRALAVLAGLAAAVGCVVGCGGNGAKGQGGDAGAIDATSSDALPEGNQSVEAADCGLFPIAFPDAATVCPEGGECGPDTCAITAADVACDAGVDCVIWEGVALCGVGCGVTPVIGVNKGGANKVNACQPACPAPSGPGPGSCGPDSGLYTQDCKLVPDEQHVAVACVSGQCMASGVP